MAKGEVMNGMLDTGSNMMSASCHHSRVYACGGCYARLSNAIDTAIDLIDAGDKVSARDLLQRTITQRQAEAPKRQRGGVR